jgi:hypothetical protein
MSKFQLKRGTRENLPSSLDEGDHYVVINDGGNTTHPQLYVGPEGGGTPEPAKGYEEAVVLLEGDGTSSSPTNVTVIQNELGVDITVTRQSSGRYDIEFSSNLSGTVVAKSNFPSAFPGSVDPQVTFTVTKTNEVSVYTTDFSGSAEELNSDFEELTVFIRHYY